MTREELWEKNKTDCPCNTHGDCTLLVSYNQHNKLTLPLNDPKYLPCKYSISCPIFFWITKFGGYHYPEWR